MPRWPSTTEVFLEQTPLTFLSENVNLGSFCFSTKPATCSKSDCQICAKQKYNIVQYCLIKDMGLIVVTVNLNTQISCYYFAIKSICTHRHCTYALSVTHTKANTHTSGLQWVIGCADFSSPVVLFYFESGHHAISE